MIESQDMSGLLIEKKVEILVNKALGGIREEMKKMSEELSRLRSELDLTKSELKNRQFAPEPQQKMDIYQPEAQKQQKPVTVGAGDHKEQLDPADFAVEKIFYSGSKS